MYIVSGRKANNRSTEPSYATWWRHAHVHDLVTMASRPLSAYRFLRNVVGVDMVHFVKNMKFSRRLHALSSFSYGCNVLARKGGPTLRC